MANSDKNILITPNKNLSGKPEIALTGFGNSTTTITVSDSTNANVNFENSNSSFFSTDDNFSSGSVFSANDTSDNSSINVLSSGETQLNKKTVINGSGLKLNESIGDRKIPRNKKGLLIYDASEKCLKTGNGKIWAAQAKSNTLVRDGLVLHLDASLVDSYPRTGTTWYDLSGVMGDINVQNRNADFSFQVEPQTNTYCLFNSTNRTGSGGPGININLTRGFNKAAGCIELWIRPGEMTGGHGWFVNADGTDNTNGDNWFWFGGWESNNNIYFRQGNPGFCCNDVSSGDWRSTGRYVQDVWMQLAVTWDTKTRRAIIYRNGYPVYSNFSLPTNIGMVNQLSSNIGQLFSGHARGDNMQFKGYCSMYRIYNRELTRFEVEHNFLTYRNRFGL